MRFHELVAGDHEIVNPVRKLLEQEGSVLPGNRFRHEIGPDVKRQFRSRDRLAVDAAHDGTSDTAGHLRPQRNADQKKGNCKDDFLDHIAMLFFSDENISGIVVGIPSHESAAGIGAERSPLVLAVLLRHEILLEDASVIGFLALPDDGLDPILTGSALGQRHN